MVDLDEIEARLDARAKMKAKFLAHHPLGVSFEGQPRESIRWCWSSIIVSPDKGGAWRVTRFDRKGPVGHMGPIPTFAEAVDEAVDEYGVDLEKVTFAGGGSCGS